MMEVKGFTSTYPWGDLDDLQGHDDLRMGGYTIIPKGIIDAGYLSMNAKMLLIMALTQRIEGIANRVELAARVGCTISKLNKAITELEKAHHLRIANGDQWHFYEERAACLHDMERNKVEY